MMPDPATGILLGVNRGVKDLPFDQEYRRYFDH
jgi:hypothetical protein